MDQDPDYWSIILSGSGSKLFDIVNCSDLNYYFVIIYIHAVRCSESGAGSGSVDF